MGSTREKRAFVRLLQDNIVHLCKVNAIYGGHFELDGIICISGQREGQELIVKVHEKFGPQYPKFPNKSDYDVDRENNNSHLNFLKGLSNGVSNLYFPGQQGNGMPTPRNVGHNGEYESEMLDLRINSSRHIDEYRQTPSKRMKPDTPGNEMRNGDNEYSLQRSCNTSPSVDEQVENLSMSAATSDDGNSITGSPDKSQFLGKSPFITSPYHLQKKTPLKGDRWTPSTPVPTVPECRQCGFTFDNFEVLSEHNEAVHSVFTCQHCHKTFTSRSNLERHARLHTGFKPYVCAICQKAFSRKDHLSNHSAKHAYKCGHCNKRYADKPNLATHFTYEHDSILTNCCEFCNKGFANVETYEEHVKTHPQYHAVHKSMNSHKVSPSTASPKKYTCEHCKFTSPDRLNYVKHCMTHVDSKRTYSCRSCGKTYDDPLKYHEHLFFHQSETNVFECTICRQVFQTLDVLKRHEVIHLNDDINEVITQVLPCPHCNKVFRGISSLQEHIVMHNNQAKTYRCLYCNQGFGSYPELYRHMDNLRHYPTDPRMLFSMTMGTNPVDPRQYTEFLAKRNLQKELTGSKQSPVDDNTLSKETGSHDEHNHAEENDGGDEVRDVKQEPREPGLEIENDIGSDIEVVEPEAPEETAMKNPGEIAKDAVQDYKFVVTENKSSIIEITPQHEQNQENDNASRDSTETIINSETGAPENNNPVNTRPEEKTTADVDGEQDDGAALKAKYRARKRKGPSPEKYIEGGEPVDTSLAEYYDNCDMESNSEGAASPSASGLPLMLQHLSPGIADQKMGQHRVMDRKHRDPTKSSSGKLSFDIPSGPQTCSLCQLTLSSFQALEQHCFAEHNRCPCMFCPKTFAQKANRDRHICLHTGDKPYSCPECGEKFSRGDKLKLHRVRTHNIPSSTPTTQFTLKRDSNASNGGWTIHSPANMHSDFDALSMYREESHSNSSIVHGAGEWSRVTETTTY